MKKSSEKSVDLQKRNWIIISLASIPLIMTLGNSMLIPILPVMEKTLDISKLESSYIITAYSVIAIFFIPIAGYLSDQFGRKAIIMPALVITGLGGILAGWASWQMNNPFGVILIGRILQGIGASGAFPVVLPLVGDIFQDDKLASKTLGVVETSNTAGKVLSPILGAALAAIVWFMPFFSIPVFCLISACLVGFMIEKKDDGEERTTIKEYIQLIKDVFASHRRWLIAVFIIGAILMFVLFGFLFYLSSILEDTFGYKGIWKGVLLGIPLLALSVASFVSGKVIKDHLSTMKWITFSGIVLAGTAVLAIPFMGHPAYLLGVFFVCGVGIGMSLPCLDALITNTLEKNVSGIITSIYSAMRFIGVALGPPVVALLMKQHISWLVGVLAVVALGAGILAFKNIDPE